MSCKITLIGAGSVVFAKNLIGDVLQFPELSDITLCLMDIDPDRLKVAELMAQRMVAALKVKAKIIATMDRRTAVRGARYVICTIQVGGYRPGTVIDFAIPRKYGLLQTIGDTLGIGGIFRALRTIPVINAIARDIAEVGAPGCLLLNYTNPMAVNCMGVEQSTGIPHVGLCHSVQGTSQLLANLAGLPYEDISYLVAGINHMAFFLKFEYRGQDAYPLLFSLLNKPGFKAEKVRFEMMRRTGYFVTESSEHQSEYVPYFIHHGKKVIEQFDIPIDEYLRRCDVILDTWEKTEAELLGGKGGIAVNPQTHEYGSFIIHSRETNTPRVIYGNVPNRNLIDNLPAQACVEVPCLVDAQGIQPTHIGTIPSQLAAICQTNINVQTLTVEAALTGRRESIYHAAMLDPHTATVLTLDKIWALCDDLIAEHQKHGLLGEFSATVPGTGRAWRRTGDRIMAEARVVLTKKQKNGVLPTELTLTNPQAKPVTVALQVHARPLSTSENIGEVIPVKITVPAGKTVRKVVSIPFPGEPLEGFKIDVTSVTPNVFTRNYISRPRTILKAGAKKGAAFKIELSGFPAAEGTLQVRDHKAILRVAIDDTKITPADKPWEGSSVELFFAAADSAPIQQLFIVPQPGAKKARVLDSALKRFAAAKVRIAPAHKGSGYEIEVAIPLDAVGVDPKAESFLFNLHANLTALGDAHSGGKISLSGHFESNLDSSRFAKVETVPV